MSKLNGNALQIGNNATATQNCTLTANGDGTFTLARGNVGATTQDLLTIDSSGVVELTQQDQVKSGSVINTTSGTSHDFTGIPSWAKKITLMFDGVSTNGSSELLVQLGDLGGVETSGYLGAISAVTGSVGTSNKTNGIGVTRSPSSSTTIHGRIEIALLDSTVNTWAAFGVLAQSNFAGTYITASSKSLTATLDRIRLTTVNGTDTFDAGKINILYEG